MGTARPTGSRSRHAVMAVLTLTGLHRHRAEPDLSALVAFPSCRCGALIWPEGGADPSVNWAGRVDSEPRV